jgi:hypothetical protein
MTGSVLPTPNVDTLYSLGWLDLSHEPIILNVPDTHGRYYVMQMLDAYANTFSYVGKRTSGTLEGSFAIVGPKWKGKIPSSLKIVQAPTNRVWIIGRTFFVDETDLPNVHALQNEYRLYPLSSWSKASRAETNPGLDLNTSQEIYKSVINRVSQMETEDFFQSMTTLMQKNPPPATESVLLHVFERIGIDTKRGFNSQSLDSVTRRGLERAGQRARQLSTINWSEVGKPNTGWTMNLKLGRYQGDYILRAIVATNGIGANEAAESVYANTLVDKDRQRLTGERNYMLHFQKDELPPVKEFWSITMYDMTDHFNKNLLRRYGIGNRTRGLKYNTDGSLNIYIQQDSPKGRESNWLPAPAGNFRLVLRMYMPKSEVLNGTYKVPDLWKVN